MKAVLLVKIFTMFHILSLWKNSRKKRNAFSGEKIHNESASYESDIHVNAYKKRFHCEKIHENNQFRLHLWKISQWKYWKNVKKFTNVSAYDCEKFPESACNMSLIYNYSSKAISSAVCEKLHNTGHLSRFVSAYMSRTFMYALTFESACMSRTFIWFVKNFTITENAYIWKRLHESDIHVSAYILSLLAPTGSKLEMKIFTNVKKITNIVSAYILSRSSKTGWKFFICEKNHK